MQHNTRTARWRRRLRRPPRIGAAATLVACLLLATAVTPAATAATGQVRCRAVSVPVRVAGQNETIGGTLCTPPHASSVQVLVHGWTFNRDYWAAQYKPDTYSYVRAANRAGYATLAIDRLGVGGSTRPPSLFDTPYVDAHAMHHVVRHLRDGSLGTPFRTVTGVGHSVGAIVVALEAGRYGDVDAIVTTGYTHGANPINATIQGVGATYPARLDPKFAGAGYDPTYLTTVPGRQSTFFNVANTEPGMLATAQNQRSPATLQNLELGVTQELINADRTLDIPVLNVVGQNDPFFCGALTANCSSSEAVAEFERPWYGPDATVQSYVAPRAGHSALLEKNAPRTREHILNFMEQHVGHGSATTGDAPSAQPPVPSPPPSNPTGANRLLQATFLHAIAPLFADLAHASTPIPGIGTHNVDPTGLGSRLHLLANVTDQLIGPHAEKILAPGS